jgi:hypothetical protein
MSIRPWGSSSVPCTVLAVCFALPFRPVGGGGAVDFDDFCDFLERVVLLIELDEIAGRGALALVPVDLGTDWTAGAGALAGGLVGAASWAWAVVSAAKRATRAKQVTTHVCDFMVGHHQVSRGADFETKPNFDFTMRLRNSVGAKWLANPRICLCRAD